METLFSARKTLENLLDSIDFKNQQFIRHINLLLTQSRELSEEIVNLGGNLRNLRAEHDALQVNLINGRYHRKDFPPIGLSIGEFKFHHPEVYDTYFELKTKLGKNSAQYRAVSNLYHRINKLLINDWEKARKEYEVWYENLLKRFSLFLEKKEVNLETLRLDKASDSELLARDGRIHIHARFIVAGGALVRMHQRYILTTRKEMQ